MGLLFVLVGRFSLYNNPLGSGAWCCLWLIGSVGAVGKLLACERVCLYACVRVVMVAAWPFSWA